ncbi:MAG: DUF6320 domain-containing protein, partial [Asgard group archaeon]|nr:DUF6320 domain-containing protein [Asgard group archaeon]
MITNKDKRYCSRCGVEVELGVKECPLCQTPIPKLSDEPPIFTKKYPDKPAKFDRSPRRTPKQKRILAWEIVSASLLLPLIITLLTNIIINQTVSWALYPLISIVLAWLLTTIPLLFPDKPSIIIAGEVTSIMLFLLLLDLIPDLEVDWYLRLALPILA